MIIINFKNYKYGKRALILAKKIRRHISSAVVCVNFVDISEIACKAKMRVFAQHVDSDPVGRGTGFIVPESVKQVGGSGTLLNHSEHKISFNEIKKTLRRCNEVGLKVILCVASLREAKRAIKLKPWAIAFEDPKLVGSGKSITDYRVKEVVRFSKIMRKSKVIALCGAGINSVRDVAEAKKLECDGVLISSAIVNVKNPINLLKGLRKYESSKKSS